MAEVNKVCLVTCKNCQNTVEAVWKGGLFHREGWQAKRCPRCNEKIDLKDLKVTVCPHCHKVIEKTDRKTCLNCGEQLVAATSEDAVACPGIGCGTSLYIPLSHEGDYTCPICGTVLKADYIARERAKKTIVEPQVIRLPDAAAMQKEDWAVWKHPVSSFPFKSRLLVSEGTYALLLQNGVCQYPCGPGSYLLEETNLKREQRIDVAMADDATVFNTDIYCVLKLMPEIIWGAFTPEMEVAAAAEAGREEKFVFTARANGTVTYQVSDAKAFADYVGYTALKRGELVAVSAVPGSRDGILVELTRKQMSDALYKSVKTLCENEKVEPFKLPQHQPEMEKILKRELDGLLAAYGLCVYTMAFRDFKVEENEAQRMLRIGREMEKDRVQAVARKVMNGAETQFNWKAERVLLHAPEDSKLSAEANFSGLCRLQVVSQSDFLAVPEIIRLINDSKTDEAAVVNYFRNKINQLACQQIGLIAQDMINRERIPDMLEKYQYNKLTEPVTASLNNALAGEGLSLKQFTVNSPEDIIPSAALRAHLTLPKRKADIRRWAEEPLQLKTPPILLHMRDDASVYIKAVFGSKAHLQVTDPDSFFASSFIQGLLRDGQDAAKSAVNGHFVEHLNPQFADLISRVAQSVVDQTNADIREIHRLNGIFRDNIFDSLNERVRTLGMTLGSLDMDLPQIMEKSANLINWVKMHEIRSGTALDEAIKKINTDHKIFETREGDRLDVETDSIHTETKIAINKNEERRLDSTASLEDKKAETDRKMRERDFEARLDEIRKNGEIQKLLDEVASGKKTRDFEQVRREYQQTYQLQEDAINQTIREAQLQQQGKIDAEAREAEAKFTQSLNEAEHKRTLSGILRKIDESDLDWRSKLDEYDRLRRRTTAENDAAIAGINARSQAETQTVAADTAGRILRDRNDIYYEIGHTRIKLTAEEADLMEKIAQNADERLRRRGNDLEDLRQRRAILDFDQRMQERRETVMLGMEQLKQEYQQVLALRDRDDQLAEKDYELKKLQYQLDYLKKEVEEKAGVDKARFHSEEEIKKAEAQYNAEHEKERLKAEDERWKAQVAREESIAQRAEDFKKQLAEIQSALEMTRLGNEKNRDDRSADVAMVQAISAASAQSAAARADNTRQLDKLEARLDEMRKSMDEIRKSVDNLKHKVKKPAAPPYNGPVIGTSPVGVTPPVVIQQPPVYTPPVHYPTSPFYQQANGVKKCPRCGYENSIYASECANCQHELN